MTACYTDFLPTVIVITTTIAITITPVRRGFAEQCSQKKTTTTATTNTKEEGSLIKVEFVCAYCKDGRHGCAKAWRGLGLDIPCCCSCTNLMANLAKQNSETIGGLHISLLIKRVKLSLELPRELREHKARIHTITIEAVDLVIEFFSQKDSVISTRSYIDQTHNNVSYNESGKNSILITPEWLRNPNLRPLCFEQEGQETQDGAITWEEKEEKDPHRQRRQQKKQKHWHKPRCKLSLPVEVL